MNWCAVEVAASIFLRRMMQLAVVLVLLLLAALAPAQTFRGAIQGSVLDSSGAAIPGAQVKVTSADTNLVREAVTDESGNYNFTELPLGAYNVAATKEGFRGSVAKGIQVTVAASQRVDLTLTPGEAKEVVEVRAECGSGGHHRRHTGWHY